MIQINKSRKIQQQMSAHVGSTETLHRIVKDEFAAGDASELEVQTAFSKWQKALRSLQREQLRDDQLHYQLLLITGESPWPDSR